MHGVDRIAVTEEEVRRARKVYFAMVSYVDELVGRILGELERLGLSDCTRVVFTSDHGELLGEHENWFKRHYYEGSVKVPLVLAGRGLPRGLARDEVVSLVDLTATLAEWAGIPERDRPAPDGDSFAPLLRDGPSSGGGASDGGPAAPVEGSQPDAPRWKNQAVFEYCGKGSLHYMAGIRSGRYKYVYVHEQPSLLFDLEADPQEERNLARDERYASVRAELESRLLAGCDPARLEEDIVRSQQERLLVREAMLLGSRSSWDHQPLFPAARSYIRE